MKSVHGIEALLGGMTLLVKSCHLSKRGTNISEEFQD